MQAIEIWGPVALLALGFGLSHLVQYVKSKKAPNKEEEPETPTLAVTDCTGSVDVYTIPTLPGMEEWFSKTFIFELNGLEITDPENSAVLFSGVFPSSKTEKASMLKLNDYLLLKNGEYQKYFRLVGYKMCRNEEDSELFDCVLELEFIQDFVDSDSE